MSDREQQVKELADLITETLYAWNMSDPNNSHLENRLHVLNSEAQDIANKIAPVITDAGYTRQLPPVARVDGKPILTLKDIKENERYTFLENDEIDEAVLYNADVHLESLDDHCFMLIMSNERHHWHFNIFNPSRRAKVIAKIYEDNSPTWDNQTIRRDGK